jgi:hypothetical protein
LRRFCQLEKKLETVRRTAPAGASGKSDPGDVLEEVLNIARSLQRDVRSLFPEARPSALDEFLRMRWESLQLSGVPLTPAVRVSEGMRITRAYDGPGFVLSIAEVEGGMEVTVRFDDQTVRKFLNPAASLFLVPADSPYAQWGRAAADAMALERAAGEAAAPADTEH